MISFVKKAILYCYYHSIYLLIEPLGEMIVDIYSQYYLKQNTKRKRKNSIIRVGYIVYEPEVWDKLQPLFEAMMNSDVFEPILIVLNSPGNTKVGFFYKKIKKCFDVYDEKGQIIDIKTLNLDYLFYQDHYNVYYPKELKSWKLVKYVKICCIPYGYSLSSTFVDYLVDHKDFFRNTFAFFADSETTAIAVSRAINKNCLDKLQYSVFLGYPAIEKYKSFRQIKRQYRSITWTPRWSYDKDFGGSHFFEYKDLPFEIQKKYNDVDFSIRPHPFMFQNFINSGLISREEVDDYCRNLEKSNIKLLMRGPIDEVLINTDILITDISSVIVSYFVMNRPIIYCNCDMKPIEELEIMMEGMYIAESKEDVFKYLNELLVGNDYLAPIREEILKKDIFNKHNNAIASILDFLLQHS